MQDTEGGIEIGVDTLVIKGDTTKFTQELAKAQGEFLPIPRDDDGQIGNTRFKYAGYATIVKCVRPALSKYGIVLLQPLHTRGDKAVSTIILAGHGAVIQASFHFTSDFKKRGKDGVVYGEDPQEFGRCHSYFRRYQLQGMLGIEGDGDADSLPPPPRNGFSEPAPKSEPAAAKEAPKESDAAPARKKASYTLKELNNLLEAGMKQAGMKMADVREFYKEHVDKAGFEKPDSMSLEQKATLLDKMVKLKGVTPF